MPRGQSPPPEQALIGLGLPGGMSDRQSALRLAAGLLPSVAGLPVVGSAACDLLDLAHGRLDAFVACGLARRDTAAGHVLALAAGMPTETVDGERFPVAVTGAPDLLPELVDRVRRLL